MSTSASELNHVDKVENKPGRAVSESSLTVQDSGGGGAQTDVEKGQDVEEKQAVGSQRGAPGAAVPKGPQVPDGGWRAWKVVFGSWLVLFSSFGYVNAFGVYQSYYQSVLLPSKTASDIAWIGSFQLFLQFACGPFAGKLYDEGHFRIMVLVGSLIWVFSIFMLSLCKEFYQVFLAQALGNGLGLGLLFLPAVSIISQWFQKRRATAMGIVVSGSSIGGICFPIMLNKLFNGSTGFAWGVRATAFLILGCLIVANMCMETRLPPRKKMMAQMGLPPPPPPNMKSIMTDPPYVLTVIGMFIVVFGIFFPFFFLPSFALAKGVDANMSFYSLSILNAASVFGRILPNILADILGPFNIIIPCVFVSGVLIFAWLGVQNLGGVIAFAIVFGFFSGAYISIISPCLASLASNLSEIGWVNFAGIAFLFISVGALVGTPICGALLGLHNNYVDPAIFSGVMLMVGCACLIAARGFVVKRKGTQKV